MAHFSRRDFLKTGIAAAALAGAGHLPLEAARKTATDWVTLGKSGIKVTRLALGTGTRNGKVQRDLGQDQFTKLVRYAYDRGIRFFETAEGYDDMQRMLGIALKGIPRDSYRLMTKVTTREGVDPLQKIDDLRRIAQTDYFDVVLLHFQHTATWPTDTLRWQDGILEAEARHAVIAHGASVHGIPALRQFSGNKWVQIAMIRMNHNGTRMDGEEDSPNHLGDVNEAVAQAKQVHREGMGVISMKLAGEGKFTAREDRQAAMRFAFKKAGVDCVTLGYKSPAEIDEAIENLNLALA